MTVAKLIKKTSFETVGKVCHLFQDLDVSGSNLDKDLNLYPYLDSIVDINRPYKREFIGKIKWVINYLPRWTYHLLYPNIPLIVFSLFYCRYSFNQPGQIFLLCGKMWIWIFFCRRKRRMKQNDLLKSKAANCVTYEKKWKTFIFICCSKAYILHELKKCEEAAEPF